MKPFSSKLELIFEHFSFSSSEFAEKIQVPRSTISHLLSNRNKPSLDFLIKVIEKLPSLNLYWLAGQSEEMLVNQNPSFYQADQKPPTPTNTEIKHPIKTEKAKEPNNETRIKQNESLKNNEDNLQSIKEINNDNEIEQIVIFYKNGNFKSYKK